MNIICLGDSLTYGYGVSRRYCWTSLLNEKEGIAVKNCGVNGDTTGGMLARFQSLLPFEKNTVVLLMGGANDVFCTGSSDSAKANMAALIQQTFAAAAMPVVGIAVLPGHGCFPEDWKSIVNFEKSRMILEEYNSWLMAYCKVYEVPVVDFSEGFDENLLKDGLHPGEKGHELMAERAYEVIRKLM